MPRSLPGVPGCFRVIVLHLTMRRAGPRRDAGLGLGRRRALVAPRPGLDLDLGRRAELDAHPGLGVGHLGDAMLEGLLAGSPHDQEIAPPELEGVGAPAAGRPEEEAARRPQGFTA